MTTRREFTQAANKIEQVLYRLRLDDISFICKCLNSCQKLILDTLHVHYTIRIMYLSYELMRELGKKKKPRQTLVKCRVENSTTSNTYPCNTIILGNCRTRTTALFPSGESVSNPELKNTKTHTDATTMTNQMLVKPNNNQNIRFILSLKVILAGSEKVEGDKVPKILRDLRVLDNPKDPKDPKEILVGTLLREKERKRERVWRKLKCLEESRRLRKSSDLEIFQRVCKLQGLASSGGKENRLGPPRLCGWGLRIDWHAVELSQLKKKKGDKT
ncbi:hypothetical protein WN51_10469 [Melipona quadrifasciata]|uniref:Uncharacterized protein n=1 Tax=Melipona quadrifasciata TaxID=166423 RepID=A0A0M9A4I4_9HYME|nr:hypothetical protein WN51_10469 [Melipona quadrifasciata]